MQVDVQIQEERLNSTTLIVTVSERGDSTQHIVTVSEDYHQLLTTEKKETTICELVQASFEFLLAREPKEMIMHNFDLTVIQRYFPEYERSISTQL